jgi:T5SS/PEP-CTERM-associated repeat protein/autotransporter-associated beta strand protein
MWYALLVPGRSEELLVNRSSLCAPGLCALRLFTLGLLALLNGSVARAAITLSDDVIPAPPVGDPWDVGGTLSVGETQSGAMTISAGSDVTNTDGFVANMAGSTGTVTVDGTGSTWTNSGELRMGNFGMGTLNITAGGAVSVGGHGRLGNVAGGVGVATVDGPGSTLTSANFILVGREGSGTLNIQNSGVVSDSIGGIAIFEGSSGMVTINGAGSAWNNLNELQVADGGNGTLEIIDGGVATSSLGYLGVSPLGVGTATVSGSGSAWNNSDQLQVGYRGNGTLNVLDGGSISSSLGYVGVLEGGTGTSTVSGSGSTWTNSGELQVGYEGTGTLYVMDGAAVSSGIGIVGTNATGNGAVTISGDNSTWTNFGSLTVGSSGNGTLNIEHGGIVVASTLEGGNAGSGINFNGGTLRIASTDSAGNELTLNSAGGVLDTPNIGTTFTITSGIAGAGGLTKTGTGTLELTGANIYADDTRVFGGTLGVNGPNLADAADMHISAGALLNLNFVGTDTIDALFFNGVGQATGTWGSLSSAATHKSDLFAGDGMLEITSFESGTPGDFDMDGDVDGRDFLVWQRGESPDPLSAGDLADWQANYGANPLASSRAVPEPSCLLILWGTCLIMRTSKSRLAIADCVYTENC